MPASAAAMTLLSAAGLEKRYGERAVFVRVDLRVARGDRIALVGPNGCGKSTLLRVLSGELEAEAGVVAVARGVRLGRLEQELRLADGDTLRSIVWAARARLDAIERQVRELEGRLSDPDALARYGELVAAFEHAGGYDFDAQAGRLLAALGLSGIEADRPAASLSGGERARLGLAGVLLEDADVLLLDEPTNHLDLAGLEWLERFVLVRERTMVVASHDRYFLDRVATRTLAFEEGRLRAYPGAYTSYARQRAADTLAAARAFERQRERIARDEAFIDRERAGQRARQARGRRKQLDRLERLEAPGAARPPSWRLGALPLGSAHVVETTPLGVGPAGVAILRTPALRVSQGARVAIVGANGSGKTTLLRTLVGELRPIEGHARSAPQARAAVYRQSRADPAPRGDSVLAAFRGATAFTEQEARDLLARFLFRGDAVLRDIASLSGGERSRLAIAILAARPANLLALDEPTNHLDLEAREALESVLATYAGTLIVISHDRYLIDRIATETWLVYDGTVRVFEGNYSAMRAARVAEEPPPSGGIRSGRVPSARTTDARSVARPPSRRPPLGAQRRLPRERGSAGAQRRVDELEARIAALEQRLGELAQRVAEVAQQGNYMESRKVGEEYADLERSLRALYEEWAREGETER